MNWGLLTLWGGRWEWQWRLICRSVGEEPELTLGG